MRRSRLLLPLLLLAAPGRSEAQSGLTIYNDGRVLVRRTLPVALPAGGSTHRLALGNLDPATVFALDSGVTITGSAFDAAVDEPNTMRRAVGRTLWFWTGRTNAGVQDTVSATVLGVEPERFRLADGRVTFQRPGLPLFPADLVLVEPSLLLGVRAQPARPSLRLGYFTGGASWQASYTVLLGPGAARVSGSAVIASAALRAPEAEIQLLAGNVGRALPKGPMPYAARTMALQEAVADASASEEGIGEVHLYTLPGRLSLEPGVTTTAALFDPATAPWSRSFVVRGQVPYWGPLPQFGNDESTVPVEVFYTLTRQARTPFGDLPLPAGSYRLYEADAGGRPQLIGESSAGHIAAGREVRLSAGTAFDLTATRVQASYTSRRDSTRTIATADYRVTIKSAKDTAAVVEVLEERGGEWSVVSSSLPAERLSSTRTRFRVRVPARGEATLSYRIRVIW